MISKSIDFVSQYCIHCQYHKYELSKDFYTHNCSHTRSMEYLPNECPFSDKKTDKELLAKHKVVRYQMTCQECHKKEARYGIYKTEDSTRKFIYVCSECENKIGKENWDRSAK